MGNEVQTKKELLHDLSAKLGDIADYGLGPTSRVAASNLIRLAANIIGELSDKYNQTIHEELSAD